MARGAAVLAAITLMMVTACSASPLAVPDTKGLGLGPAPWDPIDTPRTPTKGDTGDYYVGGQGDSCTITCYRLGYNCNPIIFTNNSAAIFEALGISCAGGANPKNWWAIDQPAYVSDPNSSYYQQCIGWMNVPESVHCAGFDASTQRICHCTPPPAINSSSSPEHFGIGLSGGYMYDTEEFIFNHHLPPSSAEQPVWGVMDHFWIAFGKGVDNGTIVRYYVDGEPTPSIEFEPSMACGVGFYDTQAPWGTEWFGKGAADGGWFWNFRVPFYKSVLISVQHKYTTIWGLWMIVRGSTNHPINIGDFQLPISPSSNPPITPRLVQQVTDSVWAPIAFVPLISLPRGTNGIFFMSTLSVQSGNENFLEGCVHAYTGNQQFPGTVLSTGTEDYFDSAWYFNAGQFHLPVSGFTHLNDTHADRRRPWGVMRDPTRQYEHTPIDPSDESARLVTWSAYRFHTKDYLIFHDGFQLAWRNGDTLDASGLKCFCIEGMIVGQPTDAIVKAYAFAYTWQPSEEASAMMASSVSAAAAKKRVGKK